MIKNTSCVGTWCIRAAGVPGRWKNWLINKDENLYCRTKSNVNSKSCSVSVGNPIKKKVKIVHLKLNIYKLTTNDVSQYVNIRYPKEIVFINQVSNLRNENYTLILKNQQFA